MNYYVPGTKSYVLNNLHIFLQECERGSTVKDALCAVGYTSYAEAFSAIEEVRDKPQIDVDTSIVRQPTRRK